MDSQGYLGCILFPPPPPPQLSQHKSFMTPRRHAIFLLSKVLYNNI